VRSIAFVPRAARSAAAICLAIALVLALALVSRAAASPAPKHARVARTTGAGTTLAPRGKLPVDPATIDGVLAYPPRKGELTVVYLHGIHGRAENGCPYLRAGASEIGWLVCPEANLPEAPGFTWAGSAADKRAIVARAEQAAHARGADPNAPSVLVGFSQGSYVALELVRAHLGRYRGLVLLGADVEPSAAELSSAGVERVVLASGDRDAPRAALERAAERLRRQGVEARFVSLGAVGHTYAAEHPAALAEAIAWAGGA
jgi:pimeloyl-ACP methyl ester carboxylesterase